jgi:hypothetical protein
MYGNLKTERKVSFSFFIRALLLWPWPFAFFAPVVVIIIMTMAFNSACMPTDRDA